MKKKLIPAILLLAATFTSAYSNNLMQAKDPDSSIKNHIETKYKGAVTLETEHEDGLIKVEIRHQHKNKDVVFTAQGVWLSTNYDLSKSDLPTKIKTVLKESQYSSYNIDDIEVIESPTKFLYEIELEKWFNDDEKTIYITSEGDIL